MTSTRLEPPVPAPLRRVTLAGAGAVVQLPGVLLSPTLKTKSAAVGVPARFRTSTMMPLIPRE